MGQVSLENEVVDIELARCVGQLMSDEIVWLGRKQLVNALYFDVRQ